MLFSSLDSVRDRWNVLRHPFYVRWSRGELTSEELAFYAGEYRHAVVALAEATARASRSADEPALREQLERHADEERAHVQLWDDFAAGGTRGSLGERHDRVAVLAGVEGCLLYTSPSPRDRS